MTDSQTISSVLHCTVSDLTVYGQNETPLSHFQTEESIELRTTITFSDEVNGELAKLLVSSGLNLRVTFYAIPERPSREVELGSIMLSTVANVLSYTAVLTLKDFAAIRLSASKSYQIKAIVRIGASPFCIPSLMRGFISGPSLLGNTSATKISKDQDFVSKAQPEAATTKPPRRKAAAIERSSKGVS